MKRRPMSILAYCGDVLGLGHLRRNTAIVSELARSLPGTNALLVTSLPTVNFFECAPGVDFVKLPSLGKDRRGRLVARKLCLDQEEFLRLRMSMIDGLARNLRPDLVLIDHLPTGVRDELLPTLRMLRARKDAPAIVLGLRDILDDPSALKDRWRRQGTYQKIEELFDEVMIYGSREVYDAESLYGLDTEITTEVNQCGYVCAESADGSPRPTRRDLGLGDGKVVVITAGGGADGYPMMKLCLAALRSFDESLDCEVVCITGPAMDRDQVNDLRTRSSGLPVRVFWCVERAPLYFEAADLIVGMAGYNTLMEAIRLKKRTLVLPRKGPSAEQSIRAEVFSHAGVVHGVPREDQTPRILARLIGEQLAEGPPEATLPEMDGLTEVVRRLKAILERRQASPRMVDVAGGA